MTALVGTPPSGHKAGILACFIIDRTGFSVASLSVSDPFWFGAAGLGS